MREVAKIFVKYLACPLALCETVQYLSNIGTAHMSTRCRVVADQIFVKYLELTFTWTCFVETAQLAHNDR